MHFSRIQYLRMSICWPKGQHLLTKVLDLNIHTLSFLWLFLQLPETVWGLRNDTNSEKSAEKVKIHESPLLTLVDCAIYIAQSTKANKGDSWVLRFSPLFSLLASFLSLQTVSGSWKNSHRKLRVCTLRSENLVNMCWPFGQHIVLYINGVPVNSVHTLFGKNAFLIFIRGRVWNDDTTSIYCRK